MLETGDDDYAVGAKGEVSRFSIMPRLWQEKAAGQNQRDPKVSKRIATQILQARVNHFVKVHHRNPTNSEIYRCWNPRCFDATATRYANLCEKNSIEHRRDAPH